MFPIVHIFLTFLLLETVVSDQFRQNVEQDPVDDAKNPMKSLSETSLRKKSPYRANFAPENMGQRWPMGVVPYFIDEEFYDLTTVKRIVKQMGVIEMFSCLIFRELTTKPENMDKAWLYITNPKRERECVHEYSTSPANGIEVVLGSDCLHPNEILHSLFHAIGFNDEVAHPRRDHYIRVLWDNIQPKYRNLFRIRYEDAPYKLVEYDPTSIMHFHDSAFSANGAATIVTLVPSLQISSNPQIPSQLDIMKLKVTFGHECNKRKIRGLLDTCKNTLYLHKEENQSDERKPEMETNEDEDDKRLPNRFKSIKQKG